VYGIDLEEDIINNSDEDTGHLLVALVTCQRDAPDADVDAQQTKEDANTIYMVTYNITHIQ